MSKPSSLRLSHRRLAQINSIADTLGMSATEAVAYMIRKEVAVGTIPADVPGFVVSGAKGCVVIGIDDREQVALPLDAARALAGSLRGTVAGEASAFSVKDDYSFIRIGRGFKLRMPLSGEEVSMTGDLAIDLADQIERAVAL